MKSILLLGVVVACLAPRAVAAQCPDGSPPPCGQAPARRVPAAPALRDDTWLVVPFENVTRQEATAWLRQASANLLYLELARWEDVRVIDDERVADLLAGATAPGGQVISLDEARAVARRTGAGHLVMGDILRVGSRTQLVAKVFRTATGERLRTAQVTVASDDALLAAFGGLAREALELPSPPGGGSALGTTSLQAYRRYLRGLGALGQNAIGEAVTEFREALVLDTTFALAHAKVAAAMNLSHGYDPALIRFHATTAQRLGTGLPIRERRLIALTLAFADGRFGDACREAEVMVGADSADAEAWYAMGECSFHDAAVITDTGAPRFRSSWNRALVAFERVIALAPGTVLAYFHLPEILAAADRRGCSVDDLAPRCELRWSAPLRLDGDTLATPIVDPERGGLPPLPPEVVRTTEATLSRRQLAAASEWAAVAPGDADARLALVTALLRIGDVVRAADEAERLPPITDGSEASIARLVGVVDAAVRAGNTVMASRALDDATGLLPPGPEPSSLRTVILALRAVLGQLDWVEVAPGPMSPPKAYVIATWRTAAGLPPAGLRGVVEAYRTAMLAGAPVTQRSAFDQLLGTSAEVVAFGTGAAFALGTEPHNAARRTIAAVVRGDTAAARDALAEYDRVLDAAPLTPMVAPGFLLSGEAHLRLGDSTAALDRLRSYAAQWPLSSITGGLAGEQPVYASHLFGRGALLVGDLAMAMGDRALAATGYRRVIAVWSLADEPLQPLVDRARTGLAGVR